MKQRYDAIVIGSGIGGLTFAAIMSRLKGWRVLVLERHWKLGGYTQTFRRPGGYEWDVGVHYVGGVGPGMPGRQLFDTITGGELGWQALPEVYDRYIGPDFEFGFRGGRDRFRHDLVEAFPHEAAAIDRYLADVVRAARWSRDQADKRLSSTNACEVPKPEAAWGTTGAYLDANIADPRLRSLLAAQWMNYGVPPAQSSFAIHSNIVEHYWDGAWYPIGGAGAIAGTTEKTIRAAGGELIVGCEAKRVLVENGRAAGVEVAHKGELVTYCAPVVVSDAGAWTTFTKLAPDLVDDLQWSDAGCSTVALYLGLNADPRSMGFCSSNYWLCGDLDHDRLASEASLVVNGKASVALLSFPSLKNPEAKVPTAEILAPFPYEAVAAYGANKWRRRGAEYDELKKAIGDAMLDHVEKRFPGFRKLVTYREMSTPITNEFFTGHRRGAVYGYPAVPERFDRAYLQARTPLPGLFLTGADALSFGVMGAMMGGVTTAAIQLGPCGMREIMTAVRAGTS